MTKLLNNEKLNFELCSENVAIILNILQESIRKTKNNIDLQNKKAINTGIPTKVLEQILINKERAFLQFKKQAK